MLVDGGYYAMNGWTNTFDAQVDGVWGSKTLEAVKDFQDDHGLTRDGCVGTGGWNKFRYYQISGNAHMTFNSCYYEGGEVGECQYEWDDLFHGDAGNWGDPDDTALFNWMDFSPASPLDTWQLQQTFDADTGDSNEYNIRLCGGHSYCYN